MPYMLAPGARLEVGPGGRMYESMGCDSGCGSCPGRKGLGAVDKMGNPIPTSALKSSSLIGGRILDPRLAAALPGSSASPGFMSGSGANKAIAIAAVAAGAGLIYLVARKRRRR